MVKSLDVTSALQLPYDSAVSERVWRSLCCELGQQDAGPSGG